MRTFVTTSANDSGKPVRVLICAPSLDILGGQAVQATRLVAALQQEPSLEIEFLPVNPPFPRALQRFQSVKYVRSVRSTAIYWSHLLRRVRHADIVHAFSASYLSFLIAPTPAIYAAKLYGKKVVLNYRSGEAEDHLASWRRTAVPIIKKVDRVVTPSGYLVDVFAKFGLRAEAIFNHLDVERFRFRERHTPRPVFLANRNFAALYNVSCVLRAFRLIKDRHANARLILAGDGAERAQLERLAAELNLNESVEFTGAVTPARMIELYDAADVYLNSPNIDNMPLSILESYASGIPIVTTDAGGIPYIVRHGETGLMVARDDHHALAAAASRVLEETGLAARLSSNGRREVETKYTWAAVKDKWLALYHGLAHEQEEARSSSDSFTRTTGERREVET